MMPDWKSDSDYAFTSELDKPGWAWEFLRRSNRYRAAWAEFKDKMTPWVEKFGPYEEWKPEGQPFESEPALWHFDPPRRPNESMVEWNQRAFYQFPVEASKEMLFEYEGRSWRLARMYDPHSTPASKVTFRPNSAPPVWHSYDEIRSPSGLHEQFEIGAYVWFDLERPLDTQLAHVTKKLTARQDRLIAQKTIVLREIKTQPRKWRHYVQLLDANNLGISASEIAASGIASGEYQKIANSPGGFDPVARINDRIRAARRLADLGYRNLLPET